MKKEPLVNYINLHCSGCEPSQFHMFGVELVTVTMDLATDEYVFKAQCPHCGYDIINRRRAF